MKENTTTNDDEKEISASEVILAIVLLVSGIIFIILITSSDNVASVIFFGAIMTISGLMLNSIMKKRNPIDETIIDKIDKIEGFNYSQAVVSENLLTAIAIDEANKKICLLKNPATLNPEIKIVNFNDILSSELFIDNNSVTQTSRLSQAGGALVGAALLGGVGAIIGGLSGKTVSSDITQKIDLRLVINDMSNPVYDINFLNTEAQKDSYRYKNALEVSRHWSAIMDIIIKNADKEEALKNKSEV